MPRFTAMCVAFICVVIATGCAVTSSGPEGPSSSGSRATATAGDANADRPNHSVTWGNGKNPPGMEQGIPNPAGWYEAAFGPRTTEKIIYLTYDDGPYPHTTDQILKLLADNDAKATFFVLGRQVDAFPGYLDKITAAGHALGNHTQNHENLATVKPAAIRRQLTDLKERAGAAMGNCMRPPGGFIDNQAGRVITEMGIAPVLWTGHAQDWAPPSTSRMIEMLKQATRPGAVILLHDSIDKEQTVAASAVMLPWWKKHGYRLETIPACRT